MEDNRDNVVLIADRVIYNHHNLVPFEKFSIEDTKLLFSALLENNINNLISLQNETNFYLFLNISDQDAFKEQSEFINFSELKVEFYEKQIDYSLIFESLKHSRNTFFIFSDVMGISTNTIIELRNLLNSMENGIVLANSKKNEICLIGLNYISENFRLSLSGSERNYTQFLSLINTEEYFINSISDFIRVNDIDSFRDLYNDLSSKKSIEYCSQEFHEKFTHLFVEYKDLLK